MYILYKKLSFVNKFKFKYNLYLIKFKSFTLDTTKLLLIKSSVFYLYNGISNSGELLACHLNNSQLNYN